MELLKRLMKKKAIVKNYLFLLMEVLKIILTVVVLTAMK